MNDRIKLQIITRVAIVGIVNQVLLSVALLATAQESKHNARLANENKQLADLLAKHADPKPELMAELKELQLFREIGSKEGL